MMNNIQICVRVCSSMCLALFHYGNIRGTIFNKFDSLTLQGDKVIFGAEQKNIHSVINKREYSLSDACRHMYIKKYIHICIFIYIGILASKSEANAI